MSVEKKQQDTLIDVIRHGEPVGGRRFRGSGIDDPLSESGWSQMNATIGDASPWHRVITSPLQRCRHFAEALGNKLNIPVTTENNLREVGFGGWEGKSPEFLKATDPAGYTAFYQDPVNCRPEGAEPLADFAGRVIVTLDNMLDHYSGEHLLVVAHAGVVRAVLGHALGLEPVVWYRTQVSNAGITRLRFTPDQVRLEFHNRLSL
ncbi:MAG: histidine phosphatase family protein [Gammaproteobacteria bacterium]